MKVDSAFTTVLDWNIADSGAAVEASFRVKPYVKPVFLTIVSGEIVLTAENGMYACPNCNYEMDSCQCACPYCAENESCDCAIGHDKATGG